VWKETKGLVTHFVFVFVFVFVFSFSDLVYLEFFYIPLPSDCEFAALRVFPCFKQRASTNIAQFVFLHHTINHIPSSCTVDPVASSSSLSDPSFRTRINNCCCCLLLLLQLHVQWNRFRRTSFAITSESFSIQQSTSTNNHIKCTKE